MPGATENRVEGYDVVRPEYDAPYLGGAEFNPAEDFKFAGDSKLAEENEKERVKARGERRRAAKKAQEARAKERREGDLTSTHENPAEVTKTSPAATPAASPKPSVPAKKATAKKTVSSSNKK